MIHRTANVIVIAMMGALSCGSGAKNPNDASGLGGASGGGTSGGGTSGGGTSGGGTSGGVGGAGGVTGGGGAGGGTAGSGGGSGGNRTCGAPAPRGLTFSTQRVKTLAAGAVPAGFALPASGPPAIIYIGSDQGTRHQIWATTVPMTSGDGGVTTTVGLRLSRGNPTGIAKTAPSVSRARDGSTRVAYIEQDLGGRARYVEWSGDVNQDPTDVQVDDATDAVGPPALSLDGGDHPAIVFLDTDRKIHFASRPQASWQVQTDTIDVVGAGVGFTGLLDAAGTPTVLTTAPSGALLGLALSTPDASGWIKQSIHAVATDAGPRAKLDPAGRLVVMFGTPLGLGLAVRDGDTWSVTAPLLDDSGLAFAGSTTAFDFTFGVDGQIRLAYVDGRVSYAYTDGCWWYHQPIETTQAPRIGPGFALAADGSVHVAYVDTLTNELWYAHGIR